MKKLLPITTAFGELWIRDPSDAAGFTTDIATIAEILERDEYKVKQLHKEGFVPKVIIDVGAQCGIFTFLCSRLWPQARIYAFEPQLEWFRVLVENCAGNCTPINLPVLGAPQNRTPEIHHDQEEWYAAGRYFQPTLIWAIWAECHLSPAILKLDCEGSEANIIRELGLSGALKDFDIITGESHRETAKDVVNSCLPLTHSLHHEDRGECGIFFARRTT